MIRCTTRFKDMEADCIREVGDQWETTDEREAQIVAAKYGVKVDVAPKVESKAEPKTAPKVAVKKPTEPKKTIRTTKAAKKK